MTGLSRHAGRGTLGDHFRGLHVLADDDPRWPYDPVEQARHACEGGASVVQLRAKHATDLKTLEWARAIRVLTRNAGILFIMNDRFDLALLSEADGVHLGQTDLPPGDLPSDARQRLAVGRSTHTTEQLVKARSEDLDYVAFGPVFGTTSKESAYTDRGLQALLQAVELAAPRPLIAIGGITLERIPELSAAGVGGIAVISVVAGSDSPTRAVASLARALEVKV